MLKKLFALIMIVCFTLSFPVNPLDVTWAAPVIKAGPDEIDYSEYMLLLDNPRANIPPEEIKKSEPQNTSNSMENLSGQAAKPILPAESKTTTTNNKYVSIYKKNYPAYAKEELPVVEEFRSNYNGTLAHAIVGRAIWYMQYGYMIYGHEKYPKSGLIDCSNFVSLVYKDFGYTITSAARRYGTVGKKVSGVYPQKLSSSSSKYKLVGTDKLRTGDIMTFWKKDSQGKKYIAHVAIYMGKINGKPTIIHTRKDNPTAIGITNSFTYWFGEHFYEARRVLNSSERSSKSFSDSGPVIPQVYKLPPQGPIIQPEDLPCGF